MNDATGRRESLADVVYAQLKRDLFDFRLAPGERFSENEVATRLRVSRTPVREALYRLGQEGYIQVASKSGWTVRPFDFEYFESLYDVRTIIETAAVRRLCEMVPMPSLAELKDAWLVPAEARLADGREVGELDERFHQTLVASTGNTELARVFNDITERIRVVRRLEFGFGERIRQTYTEHAQILRAIIRRRTDDALMLLRSHIELAKSEVRKITVAKLASARQAALGAREEQGATVRTPRRRLAPAGAGRGVRR